MLMSGCEGCMAGQALDFGLYDTLAFLIFINIMNLKSYMVEEADRFARHFLITRLWPSAHSSPSHSL